MNHRAGAPHARAGGAPELRFRALLLAIVLAVILAAASGLQLIPDAAATAGWFGRTLGYFGTNLSPASCSSRCRPIWPASSARRSTRCPV